jgi:hypothetical protein
MSELRRSIVASTNRQKSVPPPQRERVLSPLCFKFFRPGMVGGVPRNRSKIFPNAVGAERIQTLHVEVQVDAGRVDF